MARIACLPLAPRPGAPEANRRAVMRALAGACAEGADIVVLPELASSGYVFHTVEEVREAAVSADGPELRAWAAALTGDTMAVAGFPELGADGRLHNSAALLTAEGVRAVHRKAHLWDREKLFFTPGDAPPPVVSTPFGRIGVLICYDLEFPEYTRAAALDGADLLAVPVNWPLVPRPSRERPPEVLIAQAAARVNRLAIACCDRRGTERGQEWTEGTAIVGADGWVLAEHGTGDGDGDGVRGTSAGVWAEADLTEGRDKRVSAHNDLFADRRPHLYGEGGGPYEGAAGA
ncbi:nitrilase-related carbon-nitrogen hydrolase [Streptomyces sp. ODS28]|uniref:nitrilase-related carbon-nitrogen hydrolase n=1 Tax=Streptomyces sp. ODS28 TaxID=3136688 RepID=UPI0031E8FC69